MKFKEMFTGKWCINKSMFDYAQTRDHEIYDIPRAHQDLVMERFEKSRENPDSFLDWDQAKEKLKNP